MLELEEAQARVAASIQFLGAESIRLNQASGRVLAETIASPIDLPPFDNSAMDGYAVRSEDATSAGVETPVVLRQTGQAAAGQVFAGTVEPGTCVRVFTGSPLPRGADCVVMQEDTRIEPGEPGRVSFLDRPRPWENVRFQGEDVKRGAVLAETGVRLNAGRLALLAAAGRVQVRVGRRPVVGVLATGSELAEGGNPLGPGQIYESNRVWLSALIEGAGAIAKVYPLVADDLESTQTALEVAFRECDLVVTSGGVSVGELDFVKAAFQRLAGELDFWQVAIKPGKPFLFGRCQGKHLFGLPGNPASGFVTFLLLVRPALAQLQGASDRTMPVSQSALSERLANDGNRRHFVRVKTDSTGRISRAGAQASHILSSLAEADGLVEVPANGSLAEGSLVPVWRWET